MITFRQNICAIKITLSSLVVLLLVSVLMLETLSAETRYRVKSSDNVNSIIERYYQNSELSRGQLLVGILIKNPRAFKGGNVNFLLRGKRLTLPDESNLQQISAEKASELLSEHARFFRFGITGDLSVPTFFEMKNNPEEQSESNDILAKQKIQTKKIDQLQQESNELKKQLEVLFNEKIERDQRLLELEKSLNNIKKPSVADDSVKAFGLKESNKQLQQIPNKTKNELVEDLKPSIELKRKIESSLEVLGDNNVINGSAEKVVFEPSVNILPKSKLTWLIPLILLVLFLFYIFSKKKQAPQLDDVVKTNAAGYIDPYEGNVAEFQDSVDELEESSLETSVKLDVARAYIEAEDTQSALDILTEIMEEGSDEQRQQAHDLLETISSS